jgi:hypothetical protein
MPPLPRTCSSCRQAFDRSDPRRRLVVLEARYALCSECEWTAAHPEARLIRIGVAARQTPVAA